MEPTSKRQRTRQSAQETKAALIAAGLEQLIADGFSLGLDHITLERALRHAGLPRSSAYNVWAAGEGSPSPQEQFQREVLHRLLFDHLSGREFNEITTAAAEALRDADPDSPTSEVLSELVRRAGKANIDATATSEFWRLRIAAQNASAHLDGKPGYEDVRRWITEAEEGWRERLIDEIYRPLTQVLGLQPRPEFGDRAWELLAIAAGALIDGLVYRLHYLDGRGLDEIDLTDESGQTRTWSIFALLLEAIVFRLAEPTETRFGDVSAARGGADGEGAEWGLVAESVDQPDERDRAEDPPRRRGHSVVTVPRRGRDRR